MTKVFNLKADIEHAVRLYPGLWISEIENKFIIQGDIELIHPTHNSVLDTFSIEIFYPDRFPFCFPKVIETENKIERSADRHINVKENNTLCLAVPPEEQLLTRNGISTVWFIKNVLLPRLAEEYEVNRGGKYTREYSHGLDGYWEFYFKKLKTNDPAFVINTIESALNQNLPKGSYNCPCGSGKKFKKCHRNAFYEIGYLNVLDKKKLALTLTAFKSKSI
ncbi:MAG TPA: SEC-C domain-containing protein [Bacteroidia bacterium]|nr:SEC-C domain-containing protein [Bacteroidia bacterium]